MLQIDDQEGEYLVGDVMLLGKENSPVECDPDTLQMHCAMFDDLAHFLILQYAVSLPTANPSQVEKLGPIH